MSNQQAKVTRGEVQSVPCPWCGFKHDMREEMNLGMIDNESEIECVHEVIEKGRPMRYGCGRIFQVVGVKQTTIITVRHSPRDAEIRARKARQGGAPVQHRGGFLKR